MLCGCGMVIGRRPKTNTSYRPDRRSDPLAQSPKKLLYDYVVKMMSRYNTDTGLGGWRSPGRGYQTKSLST